MEIIKKEVKIYIVEGKEFLDEMEAKKYKDKINEHLKYKYYNVSHSPDLIEGRGFDKKVILAIPHLGGYTNYAAALQYCMKNFGNPLEFVMGVEATPNWVITEIGKFNNLAEMKAKLDIEVMMGIGSYAKRLKRKIIYLNEKGKEVKIHNSNHLECK